MRDLYLVSVEVLTDDGVAFLRPYTSLTCAQANALRDWSCFRSASDTEVARPLGVTITTGETVRYAKSFLASIVTCFENLLCDIVV